MDVSLLICVAVIAVIYSIIIIYILTKEDE
jgi:hypothetical protein